MKSMNTYFKKKIPVIDFPTIFRFVINQIGFVLKWKIKTCLVIDEKGHHKKVLLEAITTNPFLHVSYTSVSLVYLLFLAVSAPKLNLTDVFNSNELNLTWDSHVMGIVFKANRMLGLLKKTCPLMTDIKVRRALYLSLVKSQLTYATEVWSPASVNLRTILERVQRRATRWILRTRIGEMSYKQRLLTLRLLPLTYDRELRDLLFLYNCISGYTDLTIERYLTFTTHGRSRSKNPTLACLL